MHLDALEQALYSFYLAARATAPPGKREVLARVREVAKAIREEVRGEYTERAHEQSQH